MTKFVISIIINYIVFIFIFVFKKIKKCELKREAII
jgi:hypothetical protein